MSTYTAYFDGSCEPHNPGGVVGFGAAVFQDGTHLWSCSHRWVPPTTPGFVTTNNIAEHLALLVAFDYFIDNGLVDQPIQVRGDSKFVIEQVFGTWKIKYRGRYYEGVALANKERVCKFTNISGKWIPREENTVADKLSRITHPLSRPSYLDFKVPFAHHVTDPPVGRYAHKPLFPGRKT